MEESGSAGRIRSCSTRGPQLSLNSRRDFPPQPATIFMTTQTHSPEARRTSSPTGRWSVIGLLVVLCLFSTGCVRRRLTVRTFPPGAQVFVDDQEVGVTPCSTNFIYYGTRKLTIIKDGYRTETLYQEISPPWYQIPPLDFAAENLTTREFRDERIVDVTLVPQEVVPPEQLQSRAQSLRDQVRGGGVTSLPPGAAAAAEQNQPPKIGLPGDGLPGGEPQLYLPDGVSAPPPSAGMRPGSGETYISPPTGFTPAPADSGFTPPLPPNPYLPPQ